MLYTNNNIGGLPNLEETVDILSNYVGSLPILHRDLNSGVVEDPDMFLLTRTERMFSLKPNISRQGALFGWWNDYNPQNPRNFRPSLYSDGEPNYLLNNIIREDFELIMESHPLYLLLAQGIRVPGMARPLRIHNPYGLAHSYGFRSPFISLTSSLITAAFHASHSYNEATGTFEQITDESRTGMIFVFNLPAPFGMISNLSTVGRQAFLRPGLNKLFAYACNPDTVFVDLPYVQGFQFRHSEASTQFYHWMFGGGADLYPDELIARKARMLRERRVFSRLAFQRNLELNPRDDRNVNMRRMQDAGYRLVTSNDLLFTEDELARLWFDNVRKNWQNFWDMTAFPMLDGDQFRFLLSLPDNPDYRRFFIQEEWFRAL